MLITRTFLSKSNTIVKGSQANLGSNPVFQLFYGNMLTRCLLYFDHNKVKQLVADKTYPDITKLKHTLHLWNASDINIPIINDCNASPKQLDTYRRATSYSLVLFKVPVTWDQGRGMDYEPDHRDLWKTAYSEFGSNWYNATTDTRWNTPGIYTSQEIDTMIDESSPAIIAIQHFDFGNETIDMDITYIFNKFITDEEENYGFCLAFTPAYEEMKEVEAQYAGFWSSETHTFFEPYVETTYNETIEDDRVNFYIGKENRLYFYSNVGGNNTNLDELPTCTVDDVQYEVFQATKGVYYISLPAGTTKTMSPNTMYYDVWDNIIYNGTTYDPVELSFTTKESHRYFTFGLPYDTEKTPKFTPLVYGIKNGEKIKQEDCRKLVVDCKINYTNDQLYAVDNLEYRLYTIVEQKTITITDWAKIDREYNTNSFIINTSELVPQTYYIDIKAKYNMEEIVTREALKFTVLNEYEDK